MKSIIALLFSLGLSLVGPVQADCDAILTHGLRNIELMESNNAVEALKFANYCEFDQNQQSEDQVASAHIEIFGHGKGSGGYSRTSYQNDIKSWCDLRRDQYSQGATVTAQSQTIHQGAVDAWSQCNQVNSESLHINPIISADRRIVDIGVVYTGPTASGVPLYGVKPLNFVCTATGANGNVKFPLPVDNMAVQFHCVRNNSERVTLNGQAFTHTPSGSISIQSASHPFQLFFAEEYDPPAPLKELLALRQELIRRELPVGTVVSTILPPDKFLSSRNPQFIPGRWAVADGSKLPAGTIFESITGQATAPDMSGKRKAMDILTIINGVLPHGAIVDTLKKPEIRSDATWYWFASGNDIKGNRAGNDYEQAEDRMKTWITTEAHTVIATGSTHNFKHNVWGQELGGTANILGIAALPNQLYYYVKIN